MKTDRSTIAEMPPDGKPDRRRLALFPGFALRCGHDSRVQWNGLVSGVAVRARSHRIRRRVLINLLGRLMDARPEQLQTEICRRRTEPFFLAPARATRVRFTVQDRPIAGFARTKRNGHFRIRVHHEMLPPLPATTDSIEISAAIPNHQVTSRLHLLEPRGLSVISDIDDTIKFSNVENRAELLANTFLREFQVIPGMSDVYGWLAGQGARFHYVTASPWQLHEHLQQFMIDFSYPDGSMHFRTFRLSDHLLKRLGVIHRGGKSSAVRRILASCPQRKFVLIGDSGEKDPQIYARCFRDHPHAIQRILIRLTKPEHRYRESIIRARIGLPEQIFATFQTGEELGNLLADQI